MTQSPLFGPHYFILGLKMLTRPGIRRWVILPVCINILIFALLGGIGWHYFSAFNHWFIAHTPDWLHWLTPLFSDVYLLIFFDCQCVFFYLACQPDRGSILRLVIRNYSAQTF